MKVPAKTKMMMLKNSLTSKPLRVVERLGYTSKQYQTALQKLDQKYGGEERLMQRYLEAILRASPVEETNLKELKIFSDRLIDIVVKLEDSDQHQELAGVSALYIVVQQKLPEALLIAYQEWLHRRPRKDGLSLFYKWLQKQVVYRTEVEDIKEKTKKKTESNTEARKNKREKVTVHNTTRKPTSKGTHYFHLHFERRSNPPERVDAAVETRNAFGDSEFAGDVVLRTVSVWLIGSEGQRIQVNAFLDDGSDSTYVRDDIATALGLEAKEQTLRLTDSCIPLTSKKVSLTIKSIDGETQATVEAWTLNEMCQGLSIPDWSQHKVKLKHLKNIPFPKAPGRKLNDRHSDRIRPSRTYASIKRVLRPNWNAHGKKNAIGMDLCRTFTRLSLSKEDNLRQNLSNSDDNQLNQEEILAMSKVENSRRWTGGRYEVAIPWKEETPSLPDNREEAEKRLLCLEKTLLKKPEVASRYKDAMNANVLKGYVRKLEPNEAEDGPTWYLPHFPIIREDRETTEVRIVFGSAERCKGVSLNDAMLTGPKLQRDVLEVLLRFRLGPVALVADIKEMFSQVVLAGKDRKYHRLLWRDLDPAKPMDVYEAVRLTFGDSIPLPRTVRDPQPRPRFQREPPSSRYSLAPRYFLAPYIIRAKMGLQEAWLRGLERDEEFPDDLKLSTHRWAEQLPEASQVKIPRCYRHHEEAVENVSLHTFIDASRLAYAAVSYVRDRHVNGEISVALVTAKARVTPIKLVSVPRLELRAAVLGVRLAETVSEKLEIPVIQHTLWTDIMNVIYWIQGHSRRLKSFVANQVAEIQRKSDPAQWRHVPGDQNPADDATSGLDLRNLFVGSRWFKGPAFLQEWETSWPLESHPLSNDCSERSKRELTKINLTFQSKKGLPLFDIERFSSWRRLSGVTAWILRFISKSKRARLQNTGLLMGEKKLSDGNESVMSTNLEEDTGEQIMASLPEARLGTSLRCFGRCGVDFTGPLVVKLTRKVTAKRYLCLFICASSRAVHLEIAYSMDTASFLNAFSRMVARRGKPEVMISDNGTNLTSAERELRVLISTLDQTRIKEQAAHEGIRWRFNPPGGSHHGGIFEALIKSAKKALRAILGESRTTDEELLTAVVEVEGILNSRPLSYCSNDTDDENVLTPNHLLYGQMGGQLAPKVADEIAFNPRNRWRFVQDLINKCWKRLMKEYLLTLNTRNKWVEEKRNLVPGDVVLVVDPGNLRGHWPLGRIQEVFPGPDGKVRVVRVRTGAQKSTYMVVLASREGVEEDGHDVTTAVQLKEAIDSYGAVKGCWAAVCELHQAKQMLTPVRWAGISQLNSFLYECGSIKRPTRPPVLLPPPVPTVCLVAGPSRKCSRFAEQVENFLLELFLVGEENGRKVTPPDASRRRRTLCREGTNQRLFDKEERLTAQQIASYFSRLVTLKKTGKLPQASDINVGDQDVEPLEREIRRYNLRERVKHQLTL
ncbi:hypothetical protein AWC38_SpisGene9441 [Stylophora pistillata]|uniref:Integrase catalytic domain-containing protein n=1 Tax=Stylophora pistillata TaxID=50429 RepID=A0A2B4SBG5_STYPI|nr:hypothetical protein AWC38_SpisGene9441 [Stylophora pistillata]